MQRREFLKHLSVPIYFGPVACALSGCGTLLHTDRVHRPHSHQIDWKVAALNGLGMLFFFVPGVVAFAVDFYTGAIYLPYDECYLPPTQSEPVPSAPAVPVESVPSPPAMGPSLTPAGPMHQTSHASPGLPGLRQVHVPRERLNAQTLEQVVSAQVGQQVSFEQQPVRISELAEIDSFDMQRERHESDHQFGFSIGNLLDRLRNA